MVTRGGGWRVGEMSRGGQRCKLPIVRGIRSGDLLYSMMAKLKIRYCIFESGQEKKA